MMPLGWAAHAVTTPVPWLCWATASVSEVLPMPLSPVTRVSPPLPALARRRVTAAARSSSSRPTNSGGSPLLSTASGSWRARKSADWSPILRSSVCNPSPGTPPNLAPQGDGGAVEGAYRIGGPTRAVQRQHQVPLQPLLHGVLRDGGLDVGDQVSARAGFKRRVQPRFNGRRTQRGEPLDVGGDEVAIGELAERVSVPAGERFTQYRSTVSPGRRLSR